MSESSTSSKVARSVLVVLGAAGCLVGAAGSGHASAAARPATSAVTSAVPAHQSLLAAASGAEQVTAYDAELTLKRDGSMHVQETIGYDFGTIGKHGIERFVHVVFKYDKKRNRQYPISHVTVSSPTGARAKEKTVNPHGPTVTIRIGDPDFDKVTGKQTYIIGYDVAGVVNTFPDHQELYWNVTGNEWLVPIDTATVKVSGPAAIQKQTCYEGARGRTRPCRSMIAQDGTAEFTSTASFAPGEGLTVVASFPVGTFPNAKPILKYRWTLARAFSVTPTTVIGSLLLLALLGGSSVALVAGRGRDRRFLGLTPGLQPGYGQDGAQRRVPWLRRDPVAVSFTPPEGVRPGQLGTLIDERADIVDVTATIIDLAVRGLITIEEVGDGGEKSARDWRLVKLPKASTKGLRLYESKLYDSIFKTSSSVRLSALRQTFRSDLQSVQRLLYEDVTEAGWFLRNPATVRARWSAYGVLLTAIGAVLTGVLVRWTTYGLIGAAVLLSGVLLLVLARRMPARTAAGTAVLVQAQGFRLYLEKAEADQIRFEEGEDIFSRYLPYAIIFGVADRWAAVFAQLAASGTVEVPVPTWYVGTLYGAGYFNYTSFSGSMDNFATIASDSIAAATPSSSGSSGFGGGGFDSGGGFSGGGGGGGGGGSW